MLWELRSMEIPIAMEYVMLMIGFGGAFICALMTIKYLIAFVQKHSFAAFAVYRMVLAVGFWLIYR